MFVTLFVFLLISNTVQSVNISWSTQRIPKNEQEQNYLSLQKGRNTEVDDAHRQAIIEALETGLKYNDEVFRRHLTQVLLKNVSRPMPDGELALWISALIARNENPRDYNSLNLLADLLHRVDADALPRPFLVLTLCNAGGVTRKHLQKLIRYSNGLFNNSTQTLRGLEIEALVLKTLACAASLSIANLDEFVEEMTNMAKRLKFAQSDGYFESIYTTSLITQALTAFNIVIDPSFKWNEEDALEYLRKESTSGGLTKAYYITLALNARRVPFLKNLYQSRATQLATRQYIHVILSLRSEEDKDVDFAMTLRVPGGYSLFQIMLTAADFSYRFKFSYIENRNSEPLIYEVDNTPNDPEKGLYWLICSQTDRTKGFETPSKFYPHDDEHIILWYRTSNCPDIN